MNERIREALALVLAKWPVEAAQAGGHLERDLSAIAFGQSITPRAIAKRWRTWLISADEPMTPIGDETALEMVRRAGTEPAGEWQGPIEAQFDIQPAAVAKPRKATAPKVATPIAPTYTVKYAPTLTDAQRATLASKLAQRAPSKRTRKVDPNAYAQAGERVLAATAALPDERSCVVRITYRSMGDETLATDTEPMPPAQARRMRDEINEGRGVCNASAVLFRVGEPRYLAAGVRLVVYPSQRSERDEATEQQMAVA